ncbi:hypothetical protein FB561_7033 [Kribbella amoyensis]|uniref:Uncharacterized protein n=1 Tax=Kribbella amoyensis TaxID=996641 RepID=A0A561B2R4_9ACTN|nr:DUF6339 family protein [Kribbella amoyensis]TWD73148.1 hypothetical protein FB561_7033 [Kribbella amoyensis]
MTTVIDADLPATLGLLPDSVVSEYLGQGVRSGHDSPPHVALRKAAEELPETEARWRTAPVRELLVEAMHRFDGQRVKADAWLAPRLHATLRMTRAEAADSRRWNYLSLIVGPDYVVWRHRGKESVAAGRFCGPHYTQALARLWWAAELFRNGGDYRSVEVACQVQDVLNTTMRLDVIDHRPTALTIVEVLKRLTAAGTPRLGDQVNALSSAVNAAGSTLMYDILAPDQVNDPSALYNWIADAETMSAVPWERLPYGPEDGEVSATAVRTLLPLFENLLAEAPVRQRPRHSSDDEAPN